MVTAHQAVKLVIVDCSMKTELTMRIDIFMAGDIAQAKQVCREYCFEVGLCVTIEAVDYIYTGGEEAGFRVGLINYPRFPTEYKVLKDHALQLANKLLQRLFQHSWCIVEFYETTWFTRRDLTSPPPPTKVVR